MDVLGATYNRNGAGLFVWGRLSEGQKGVDVSDKLLYNAGVFITPGFIFGKNGENYIRISLCANVPTLERALEKVKNL
jgi:aspartate/methionine/tyrosine aminotransferase